MQNTYKDVTYLVSDISELFSKFRLIILFIHNYTINYDTKKFKEKILRIIIRMT